MAEQALVVRSQLIALESLRLVLPNTAIAEVIGYTKLQLPKDSPAWFLGYAVWRGQMIPVVSYERMINQPGAIPGKRSRIIVLNSISADPERPFYGLLSTGIPRLVSLDMDNLQDAPEIGDTDPLILRQVIADKNAAIIPDQYELEARLKSQNLSVYAAE